MTKATLVLALLALPLTAWAQQTPSPNDPPDGAIVTSAQVSGFELGRLSPGLQEDIARIAGGPLDRKSLGDLAARIEEEQPRYVAAVRVTSIDSSVRVVFVVAHMRDQDQRGDANARYLIERVETRGIDESRVEAALNNELQTLVGTPLGSEEVDKIQDRIRTAFPDYDISRRVSRGYRSGAIRLRFIFEQRESARWLRFTPMKTDMVFHSDQGWGAFMDFPIGGRDFRVTPIIAIDHGDELVEEFSGFGVRVESRKLGTERLGASFEWTTFEADWRDATFAALARNPTLPGIYEDRSTITPLVNFAITRQLSVGGGVSITELERRAEDLRDSQMANAYIGRIRFDSQWEQGRTDHLVEAQFTVRSATPSLESDFDYNRYFGQAEYAYKRSHHTVIGSFLAGGIDGAAPLFERFTLGDSRTLRGWDKYDIAPAGGDRVFHTSVEYRYYGFALFLDSGAVWDKGVDKRTRVAAGFGYHTDP
ncbi:MAG TPA: BamA/TamA family outer membrane protein, partial [Vicinamibacterales bacterium]